jgi:ankyrin repeat protein
MTDLVEAVKKNDAGRVKEILARDPRALEARGPGNESPILIAAYHRAEAALEALLAHATLDVVEASALGKEARVEEIVRGDPGKVKARSFDGWTPLHLAGFFGQLGVARVLLAHGAPLDARSENAQANEPLHAALAGARNPALVRLLVERGASVTARAEGGWTPLHLAASRGDRELVELFLDRSGDAAAKSDDGKTPADIATERGHPDVAARLREVVARGK